MNLITNAILWICGVYLYILIGTIISSYSWKIYQRNKGNWDYPISEIIFWPFSYLTKCDQTFIQEMCWKKNEYIVMSSILWVPRLIWNALLWAIAALFAIVKLFIKGFRLPFVLSFLVNPLKKVSNFITGPS